MATYVPAFMMCFLLSDHASHDDDCDAFNPSMIFPIEVIIQSLGEVIFHCHSRMLVNGQG